VRIGTLVAWSLTALHGVVALWSPIPGLFSFGLSALFATGVRRRIRWAAFGLVLFLLVPLAGSSLRVVLEGDFRAEWPALALRWVFYAIATGLLVRAARAMPKQDSATWKYGSLLLGAFAFALPLLFRAYVVPTGGMENTILVGDRILTQSFGAGRPERGQMVVYRSPQNRNAIFIKRVVALPGDRLRILKKQLFVNGSEPQEPFALHMDSSVDDFRDFFPVGNPSTAPLHPSWLEAITKATANGELIVPPGKYFVLGDNRDRSLDSRYLGFVDQRDIKGTPALIYFSFDPPGDRLGSGGVPTPPLFTPSRIRWNRLFLRL
jgi:signal peptidase I